MNPHPAIVAALLCTVSVSLCIAAPKPPPTYSEVYGKKGEQPKLDAAKDLPRFSALAPADAMKSFKVKKGFRVELAAGEPLVNSPIAMYFDEGNRLFVVEMRDYSELRDEKPHLGRIRMLESTRGDGVFDKATVFADNLPWPTGVICYGGGLFVIASPHIIWLKDTNGDGKSDERKIVFTGFGAGAARLNVQALPNSLNWSLDNRIHGATSGNGGVIKQVAANPPAPDITISGRDFSFDPRTLTMRAEGPTAQYGMSFDSRGRKFVCSNSDHLQVLMYDARYAGRNPHYAMPSPRVSIAADGGAAEVFRISPDEPWRIIRTRWRISGVVPGMVEGGGRVSGYFTGATGATIYRGDAYGPDFADNAFIGDAGGNLVHRKKIYPAPDGVGLVAKRPDDEQKIEFLASTDTWFRPVQFQNAPDGCLYIADMYREVIEHPWSIPESIKQHIDLNSGSDRGRIWRIVPESFKQPRPVQLGKATTAELVKLLEHPNGWHRETAARLLYERQNKMAVAVLEKLVSDSSNPLAKMHALGVLDGLSAISEGTILTALRDNDPRVLERAVLVLEQSKFAQALSDNVAWILKDVADFPDRRVRFQLALSLGGLKPHRFPSVASEMWHEALLRLAIHSGNAPEIADALTNGSLSESLPTETGILAADMVLWFGDHAGYKTPNDNLIPRLLGVVAAANKEAALKEVLATLSPEDWTPNRVRVFAAGLRRAGIRIEKVDTKKKFAAVLAKAASTARDAKSSESARIEALSLVGLDTPEQAVPVLVACLEKSQPEAVQTAAVTALGQFAGREVTDSLIHLLPTLPKKARTAAFSVLLGRPERAAALLLAIETKRIAASELTASDVQSLFKHKDPSVAKLADRVLAALHPQPRENVIAKFQPALTMKGNAARGKILYTERCATCHRAGKEGFALGPDLVTVKNTGAEKLMVNILDPNREVAPQFLAFNVELKDDESLAAIIANETTTHVTLRMASGIEKTLPRVSIRGMKSSGQSLMPEGLEQNLTPQGMADLLEFIATLQP